MPLTLSQIAAALGARFEGDGALRIARAAHPAEAGEHDIAVAMDAAHVAALAKGRARAALLNAGEDWRGLGLAGAILVARPRYALAGLTQAFAAAPAVSPGVHPTAVVAEDARLGAGVAVGPLCVIGAGAQLGDGAALVAQVYVGEGARIGPDALFHPGVRVCAGVTIGARAILHPNAVIGSDGFSFVTPSPGSVESVEATGRVAEDARNHRWARIHALGAVTVGDDVEVGAGATIDSGTLTDTRVGDGTKIDNLVQVGHNVRIGANCLLCAQVGVAGSAVIGDRVVLGGQSGVADHVRVGDDVVAGARAAVAGDAKPGSVLLGAPAIPRDEALALMLAQRRLPKLIETVRALKKRLSAADPSR